MLGRTCFPMSLFVCPHQPQEPLSSLKSMAERAALSSGMEGDVPSLHLTTGNTHTHAGADTHTNATKEMEGCLRAEIEKLEFNGTKCHLTSHSASSEQKVLMILSALTQLLSLCPGSLPPFPPSLPHILLPHHPLLTPLSPQTSSLTAPRPPQAPPQHLSPPYQRSASPRRWGSVLWGRSPCPKTRSTSRPWKSRRGRTCLIRQTRRGSGVVKCLFTFSFSILHHTYTHTHTHL